MSICVLAVENESKSRRGNIGRIQEQKRFQMRTTVVSMGVNTSDQLSRAAEASTPWTSPATTLSIPVPHAAVVCPEFTAQWLR